MSDARPPTPSPLDANAASPPPPNAHVQVPMLFAHAAVPMTHNCSTPPPSATGKRMRNSQPRSNHSNHLPPSGGPSAARRNPPPPLRPVRSWSRRSASWTPEEDARLVELVSRETPNSATITTFKTWSRVAVQLSNRTGKQCRERYLNQLKPGIKRDAWTPEEERILHEAHARLGNKWVAISAQLPGRTDNCVKNHWNSMLRKRQRREAALKAAEREVNATLGLRANRQSSVTSLPSMTGGICTPLGHGRDSSDVDAYVRNGCATPSGLSSAMEVALSSGVPSPFVTGSPITPKRDAKLQISSLVSGTQDSPSVWCLPDAGMHAATTPSRGGMAQARVNIHGGEGDLMMGQQTGFDGNGNCNGNGSGVGSAHLLNAGSDAPVTKVRRVEDVGFGNSLNALATAASSLPPSPITPESRFSASRSRSASPERVAPDFRLEQSASVGGWSLEQRMGSLANRGDERRSSFER